MALAKRLGADGVHLGQGDGDPREARALLGPAAQIGVTCHDSRHLAMEAGEAGADYVAFGAFFPTTTKETHHRPDPSILSWWSTLFEMPCVAIGGITPANGRVLVEAGADFLAVCGAVWNHPEGPAAAVKAFRRGARALIGAALSNASPVPPSPGAVRGVVDRVAVDVVVEIAPDVAARRGLRDDPVGPAEQRRVGIAAPIFALAAVEADIGDRADRRPARRRRAGHVVGAEGDAMLVEQDAGSPRSMPARLAKLEDVGEIAGEEREELRQPLRG